MKLHQLLMFAIMGLIFSLPVKAQEQGEAAQKSTPPPAVINTNTVKEGTQQTNISAPPVSGVSAEKNRTNDLNANDFKSPHPYVAPTGKEANARHPQQPKHTGPTVYNHNVNANESKAKRPAPKASHSGPTPYVKGSDAGKVQKKQ